MQLPSPWWSQASHAERRPYLTARGRITAALRRWFDERGFTEVETPILQVSPGVEAHLHPLRVTMRGPDGAGTQAALHTSPEFACKKLLAAGEGRIVTFARCFRDRERSALHSPEFTMLEWYRAGEPYEALMADCAALLRVAVEAAGTGRLVFRGRVVDPFADPERLTVANAFEQSGIDLLSTLTPDSADRDRLAGLVRAAGVRVATDDTWSDLFSRALVALVEPRLAQEGRATMLCEYPHPEAALARRKPGDPRVAERFELYACGVELANGFAELTDAGEQRLRFEAELAEKARVYGDRVPIDEELLAALPFMPEASGVALGLDRLVMLATRASRIEQVLWAPVPGG